MANGVVFQDTFTVQITAKKLHILSKKGIKIVQYIGFFFICIDFCTVTKFCHQFNISIIDIHMQIAEQTKITV